MQPIRTPVSRLGEFLLHITISIHSLKFSLGMSTAARFVPLCPFTSLCPSLQISVFKVPVLEGEPLLLPLAPFLIVKVDVSALEEQQRRKRGRSERSKAPDSARTEGVSRGSAPVQTRQ